MLYWAKAGGEGKGRKQGAKGRKKLAVNGKYFARTIWARRKG
jgi:hypothetical protein